MLKYVHIDYMTGSVEICLNCVSGRQPIASTGHNTAYDAIASRIFTLYISLL